MATVLSRFVVDADSSSKRILPHHNPVYHIDENCNCGTDLKFPTYGRQSPTSDTYDRLEDGDEQYPFSRTSHAYLSISLKPTTTNYITLDNNFSITRFTNALEYNGGSAWGIKMDSNQVIASGGFLSLHTHSTRNVFLCTKNVSIARIVYPSPGLGGPCGAWNGHSITISKREDYANVDICSDNCEIKAQAMFSSVVGSAGNRDYVGCDIAAVAPLFLSFVFDPPAVLEAGFTYSINCSTDPGAAVGYYGTVTTNPPWGKFIKSQVGELQTTEDWDYDRWGNLEYMNPNCTLGIAMDIYTTDDIVEVTNPINPMENGTYTEGVWVF